MTLTHTINNLTIEVNYDPATNTEEIVSVFINGMDVTEMMMADFETDLNKVIDGVEWRALYQNQLYEYNY